MSDVGFTDYYDILQVSTHAHADTVERVFRHLAQRYHPDNQETGNSEQFQLVIEAHETLKDSEKRAQYDLLRNAAQQQHAFLVDQVVGDDRLESDEIIQQKILALLYSKCRQEMKQPGLGLFELAQMTQCPMEHMDFHLWYLREKGWLRRTEDGLIAISVAGVDKANEDCRAERSLHRITDQSAAAINL